jgi:uncharacterized protein
MFRLKFSRFKLALHVAMAIACTSCGDDDEGARSARPAGGRGGMSGSAGAVGTSGTAGSAGFGGCAGSLGTGGNGASGGTVGAGADGGSAGASGGAAGADAGSDGGGASGGTAGADAGSTPDASPPECAIPPGPKTNYPGRRWSVPAATHGTIIESNVRITMSDGIVLVGDVSYPTNLGTSMRASGKFPVILTQNPYGPVFGATSGEIFVTHGYIFASIDVRGTGRSNGVHDIFGPREADDGAALVDWASKLAGSDGKVGLHGCSQLGINQLETVTRLGPNSPVKAMIPACGSGDFYRDTAFDNGIATTVGLFFAGNDMSTGGDKAYYRDYWKERDRVARAPAMARADIPMLLWSGWHEPGAIGSLELYVALQNLAHGRPQGAPIKAGDAVSGKYQVIMGDWGHAGGLDNGIQLQWYDMWIKGIDTCLPKNTSTPLHLAELGGTKRWVNAKSYPLVETHTPFYLASGGKLARSAGATGSQDQLSWVPDGLPGGSIEYVSDPFANGAMLAGPIAARLEVTSSNRNIQLSIDVFNRAPNGTRTKITHGGILGSLRRTNAQTSWTDKNGLPIRPYLTLDQEEPLTSGQATRLDVPLWPSVWSIEPGHSIVVRIATTPAASECGGLIALPVGCNPTTPQRDSLTGGVYQLLRGGQNSSLISLPLLERGALTTTEAAASPTGAAATPLPVDW